MKLPLQITYRDVPRSETLEERIRAKVSKLDRFCDRITGCRVVIDAPHRHRVNGNLYHVCIELSVPGHEIVVNREPNPQAHDHEDLWVAIRDAFSAAQRQLQDYAQRKVKSGSHETIREAFV